MSSATNPRERAARRAGIAMGTDLSSIERRRLQVWVVMALLLMVVSVVIALRTLWPEVEDLTVVDTTTLHLALVGLSVSFTAYVLEKELALRRLTRLVVEEREHRARLDALARRLHGLVEEAQALDAPLDLDRFLHAALGCAIDLVDGAGAAVSVVRDGALELRQTRGRGLQGAVRTGRVAEQVARGGVPAVVPPPRVSDADDGRDVGLPGVAVPVREGSQLLGVLDVRLPAPVDVDSPLTESLRSFAEHLAVALRHATRYAEHRAGGRDGHHGIWSELEALNG